jgi:hypothetical protein
MLRKEHAMLQEAFVRAGGVEQQLAALRSASYTSPRHAAVASGGGGSGGRVLTKTLLRARNGFCLHARTCSAASESVKLMPLPYDGFTGLEAAIRSQGLFLCSTCVANGSFKNL